MAHLLVIDDEESICWCLARLGHDMGHSVDTAASAEEGLRLAARRKPDLVFLDIRLPGMDGLQAMQFLADVAPGSPVVVITAFGSLSTAVAAVRNGAFEYLTKPFELRQAAELIERAISRVRLADESADVARPGPTDELLGASPVMQQVFRLIAMSAAAEVSVLITGESGTGKELVARAIHRHSSRASAPLVSVNLAALSPTLVESELFGHVRGAYTGAEAARRGLLELADRGTVFFDEVGDIPPSVQVKLLRVLEQHEVTPVGDTTPRPARFRVITATNRDLNAGVRQGTFREDLLFRLAGFEIALPPLRQRGDDVLLLARHFLALVRSEGVASPGFTAEALAELQRRVWPGNVRELRHAIEHAALLARGGPIGPEHLPSPRESLSTAAADPAETLRSAVRDWAESQLAGEEPSALYDRFLAEVEPPLFACVLDRTSQNRSAAADLLGIHRATLKKRLDG